MVLGVTDDGRIIDARPDGTWLPASRQHSSSGDFRQATWGAAREEVRALEPDKPKRESDAHLVFKGSIAGQRTDVFYEFVAGRLVRGRYVFKDRYTSDNQYLESFASLQALFKRKYGEPDNDNMLWREDLYQDEPKEWGLAVSAGHLVMTTTWVTPETKVVLSLYGNDFEISLEAQYTSQAHERWADSITSQVDLDLI